MLRLLGTISRSVKKDITNWRRSRKLSWLENHSELGTHVDDMVTQWIENCIDLAPTAKRGIQDCFDYVWAVVGERARKPQPDRRPLEM